MKAHRINTDSEKSQEKSKPCIRMNINGSKLVEEVEKEGQQRLGIK